MKVWLHKFPAFARSRGLSIVEYPGWELRSRSTGGFDGVLGIGTHHTGSMTAAVNEMGWMWNNSPDRPIGNFHIDRSGSITIGAAGAANTQGRGGPVSTSKGIIPRDRGNLHMVSIEATSDGRTPWPAEMMEAYLKLSALLCEFCELDPLNDIFTHWAWCQPSTPGRKVDPSGPTPSHPKIGGTSGAQTWNDAIFNIAAARTSVKPPPPPVDVINIGERTMHIVSNYRIDTRSGQHVAAGRLKPGQTIKIQRPQGVPQDVKAVFCNITLVDSAIPCWANAYSGAGVLQQSCVNASGTQPTAGYTGPVELAPDGSFAVFVSNSTHVIVDVRGYI